jgi:hypothetical protein
MSTVRGQQRAQEVHPAAVAAPDAQVASQLAREHVARAMALLAPFIEATIADRDVSHDRALVVVTMNPHAPPSATFDDAILATHAFGRAGACDVDYSRYALDKARASHRERSDTSLLRERGAALLTADLPLVGGLHRHGWTVGVSGAIPAFDEAIGAIVIELLVALSTQRVGKAAVASSASPNQDA